MKKITSLFLALFVATLSMSLTATAHADRCYYEDCDNGLSAFLVTLDLYSLTTTASQDDRAVYIQQIHEDAATYLAEGTETALLQEAVQNSERALQAQGQTATETQIATALLSIQ